MTDKSHESEVEAAWGRARPIPGRDPALYRIAPDVIQSLIRRDRYNIRGEFGWRIEYGRPVAYRDISTESAIRALQGDGLHPAIRQAPSDAAGQSSG